MASLSDRIKELRLSAGMTQEEFGKKFGIVKSTVSLYESGKSTPNDEVKKQICSYFNISLDYLLGISDRHFPIEDLEWRYPPVKNRFGSILKVYRSNNGISEADFASQLEISKELLANVESGFFTPSFSLISKISVITGYDIDFLTGAKSSTSVPAGSIEIGGQTVDVYNSESSRCFQARLEEYCLKLEITDQNVLEKLGLSPQAYMDIRFNRMPTLQELLRISFGLGVSLDYLVGKTDIPNANMNAKELKLLLDYRDCADSYQKYLRDKAESLSLESIKKKSSVAADEAPERKASGK